MTAVVAFLFKLWGWRQWIAGGAVALGLIVGGLWVRAIVAERDAATARAVLLERDVEAAAKANRATTAALGELLAWHEQAVAAVASDRDAALATLARVESVKRRLEHDRQTVDGPVSPALRGAVDGLFGPSAGAEDRR